MEQVHGYEVEYEDRTDQTKKKSFCLCFYSDSELQLHLRGV